MVFGRIYTSKAVKGLRTKHETGFINNNFVNCIFYQQLAVPIIYILPWSEYSYALQLSLVKSPSVISENNIF